MTDFRTNKELQDFPILKDGRVYIYIIENASGKIKIGKTTNIHARYQALCGSNGQGIEITQIFVSPATWLHSLERIMHEKFKAYRIPDTEWFSDETLTFEMVAQELCLLFRAEDYLLCNSVRKQYHYLFYPEIQAIAV